MGFIRAFINPRRSMQRVGFLKHLLWRASRSSTNSIVNLGNELITAVSQKVSVALKPQLQEYIKKTLTSSQYGNLRAAVVKAEAEMSENPKVKVEIQDVYLANPNIPSGRGRLVRDDWNRYAYLALDLGLLRKGTYSLMVRGQTLLSFVSEDEKNAFNISGDIPYEERPNPFFLTVQQKILLLFAFVEGDGDVLRRLYTKILGINEEFINKEYGDYLAGIYRTISKEYRSKARSGDDLQRVQRLVDTAAKIEAVKEKSAPGGKNPREHALAIRVEPFVDIGLLAKPDPFAYRYQITDATKTFFEPLINSEGIDHFLQHCFFKSSNKALALNGEHTIDRELMLSTIQKAYSILTNPLGYAPILEVCLLAGIYSITERGAYFEIAESIDILKALQKEKPELVRFNVDRWGTLTFVKFIAGKDG